MLQENIHHGSVAGSHTLVQRRPLAQYLSILSPRVEVDSTVQDACRLGQTANCVVVGVANSLNECTSRLNGAKRFVGSPVGLLTLVAAVIDGTA